mmetsp:Transcript_49440/g.73679  ORF Transcript_49440/g.73679 Transcript_49440/m.73679 type:complete len:156 (-) Transcript_49440:89-556(-)
MDEVALSLKSASLKEVAPVGNALPTFLNRSFELQGKSTHFLVQLFSDQILIVISQLEGGKVGTWISCEVEELVLDSKSRFNVNVLLGQRGRDDPLLGVYARRITEQIAKLRSSRADVCPPILLGISILDNEGQTFSAIVDVVLDLYKEAVRTAST